MKKALQRKVTLKSYTGSFKKRPTNPVFSRSVYKYLSKIKLFLAEIFNSLAEVYIFFGEMLL